MELVTGIEPVTLSLPRIRSADWATPAQWTIISLWIFVVAGTGLEPATFGLWARRATNCSTPRWKWWREKDSNLRSRRRQIYSLLPLAARESLQKNGAGDRNWTHNLLITSQLLYLLSYASIITTRWIVSPSTLSVKNLLKTFLKFFRSLRSPLVLNHNNMKRYPMQVFFLNFLNFIFSSSAIIDKER